MTLCRAAVVFVYLATAVMAAQPDDRSSVAGDWSLSIHGDHVMTTGLSLEQDGTVVTGKFMLRGKAAPADGEFVAGKLTLTVRGAISRDHQSKPQPATLVIIATMKEDGTLEGEMQSAHRPVRITAERFRPGGSS
jgi:hypothetical protein